MQDALLRDLRDATVPWQSRVFLALLHVNGPMTTKAIALSLRLSVSNTSHALKRLTATGHVIREQRDLIYYKVKP